VVLERLSPVERAVFLLREVFGYGYADVAAVVQRTEVTCRQLLRRARRHVAEGRPRFEAAPEQRDRLAQQFMAAVRDGDLAGLEVVLADDVVLHGDGGGKAPALGQPLHGSVRVGRFLLGLARQAERLGFRLDPAVVNGSPGAEVFSRDGAVLGTVSLAMHGGCVTAVYNQINPDKLGHLGPVGDLAALMSAGPSPRAE
jgi:RNA polymerase sigma-70 factor (ECF subfamily)